jgi:alpha-glucosidase
MPAPSLGAFLALHDDHHACQLRYQRGTLEFAPALEGTIRVRFGARTKLPPAESEVVSPLAALAQFEAVCPAETGVILETSACALHLHFEPFSLQAAWPTGEFFLDTLTVQALRDKTPRLAARAPLAPDARIYGLGEKTGWLDKRHRRYKMRTTDVLLEKPEIGLHTDPLYASFPVFFVHTARGTYGIYVDNTEFTTFDFVSNNGMAFAAPADVLTFYMLPGPTLPDVLRQYTALTGRMPLPALWTLGYHQCRWGYANTADFFEVARQLRERHIPADGLWFDIDYMRGYRVFTWEAKRFPAPGALIANLQEQGLRAITIIDPGVKVDPDYAIYQQGRKGGHFIKHPNGQEYNGNVWPGRSAFPDFHSAETRAWWADLVRDWVTDYGLAGVWNDMNEPASTDVTGPLSEALHARGQRPHPQARNTYALHMARATYTGLLAADPDSRPFILTRSAFSGAQAVTALWGGDNSPAWEHVAGSIPQLINLGLSGMPFVGVDIGGFAGDTNGELLARWFQVGAFYPFCRNHAAAGANPHEPWAFGPEVEAICRAAVELRYRLLPYFYGLFREAALTGAPILRPLVWHYPTDPATFNLNDQFLLGRDVLVAPVVNPGLTARAVYLPKDRWHDWHTGAAYDGPTHILAHAPLDTVPLYVRAGAILPQWPLAQHTDAIPREKVTFHLWPGDGALDYYEDDGLTRAYEQDAVRLTPLKTQLKNGRLTVTLKPAQGAFETQRQQWIVTVRAPAVAATLDGETLPLKARNKAPSFAIPDDGHRHTLVITLA